MLFNRVTNPPIIIYCLFQAREVICAHTYVTARPKTGQPYYEPIGQLE